MLVVVNVKSKIKTGYMKKYTIKKIIWKNEIQSN